MSHVMNADYSPESMRQGQEGAQQAWGQAWQDVRTSTVIPGATPGALLDADTDWQWDGPPQPEANAPAQDTSAQDTSAQDTSAQDTSGEGER